LTLTLSWSSNWSSVIGPVLAWAALLTRMSTPPSWAVTRSAIAVTCASSPVSQTAITAA
jgi:hypothetical protein